MVQHRKISNNNVKSINFPADIVLALFAQSWCNVPSSVLLVTYSVDVEEPFYTAILLQVIFINKQKFHKTLRIVKTTKWILREKKCVNQ